MKRAASVLLCSALCVGILLFGHGENFAPAQELASSRPQAEELAERLKALGLFLGDETGNFDLDRAPTRVEALAMLIRSLGEDAQAKAAGKTHPFSDVPAWADGYVSWGYDRGYTKGISVGEFGSDTPAGSDMYLTFMLRALGYSVQENGQFTWNDPYLLAYRAGLLPTGANYVHFTRGDAVTVTVAALWANLSDGDMALYQRLSEQGAFSPEEFSSQFPQDPFSQEHTLFPLVDQALDKACPTGQPDWKTAEVQEHIIVHVADHPEQEQTWVFALAVDGTWELDPDGGYTSCDLSIGYWQINLDAQAGQVLSCEKSSEAVDNLPLSAEEGNALFDLLSPSLQSGAEARFNVLLSSGEIRYTAPTYDQAVAEVKAKTGYRDKLAWETPDCTILVYDLTGFMGAPAGNIAIIYKAGSQPGEGVALHGERPYPLLTRDGPKTIKLSEDKTTFTYTYRLENTVGDFKAGTYTYTVDLPTGRVEESYTPME